MTLYKLLDRCRDLAAIEALTPAQLDELKAENEKAIAAAFGPLEARFAEWYWGPIYNVDHDPGDE